MRRYQTKLIFLLFNGAALQLCYLYLNWLGGTVMQFSKISTAVELCSCTAVYTAVR